MASSTVIGWIIADLNNNLDISPDMDCAHGHHHHHHHHHHNGVAEGMTPDNMRILLVVFSLTFGYFLLQLGGGYFSGSLALIAEAGHKLSDTMAIGMALFAAWLAKREPTPSRTFGFGRIEILVALINGSVLLFVAMMIMMKALGRVSDHHHHEIEGNLMLIVACVGFALNVLGAWLLRPSKNSVTSQNLNVKSAYWHILTDLMGSLGTVISAGLIILFHWHWIDSVLSMLIAVMVLANGFRILIEALGIFMEAAPKHIPPDRIEHFLTHIEGVLSVHDIHIWTITTNKEALLAHVMVDEQHYQPSMVQQLENSLRDEFGFCHLTLQLEPADFVEDAIPF